MPGLIVKPRPRYLKTGLKRMKIPKGRKCRGDPMKICSKKPVKHMPGGAPDEYICIMHFFRYLRHGGNITMNNSSGKSKKRGRKTAKSTTL